MHILTFFVHKLSFMCNGVKVFPRVHYINIFKFRKFRWTAWKAIKLPAQGRPALPPEHLPERKSVLG